MEKDEKTIIEPVVDDTIDVKDVVADENPNMEQVDDNTAIEPEDVSVEPAVEPVVPPVVDEPVAPPADIVPPVFDVPADEPVAEPVVPPVEDVTLAPTDDVIPAPEDDGTFPMGTVEPVSPEIPVDTIPATETIPLTVDEPVTSDVVPEVGDESPADVAVPGECPNCEGDGCPVCDSNSVANLFGTMQEAVTIIWKFHLKTRKFSVHIALNDFYHQMIHMVDDLIEQYQGIHGIIDDVCTNCVCADGGTEYEYLNNLRAYVENNKGLAGTESEIQSAFDDILKLIDTTLYKINNLTENNVKSFDEFVYEDYAAIKESCKYDRYGDRSCDDPDDPDYDPEMENGECGGEEEE